jgi:hypothetical protein
VEELDSLAAEELNNAAKLREISIPEPISITAKGTILAGFGVGKLAKFELKPTVYCIEFASFERDAQRCSVLSHSRNQRSLL